MQMEFRPKYKRAITDFTELCQIKIEDFSFVFIGTSQTHLPRQNKNTTFFFKRKTFWTDFVAL